jgi:Tfp pilus assembly protein PilF
LKGEAMNKKFFMVLVMGLALAGCSSSNSSDLPGNAPVDAALLQNTPEAFQQKAMILLAQGQIPAAVETLQKAIELFPQDKNAYFALAQVFMKMGSFDAAIGVCQQALQNDPENGHVYLLMAGCYDLKNEPQKAIEFVKTGMAIFQKKNDTQSFEAAATVLQKLTTPAVGQVPDLMKVIQ